MTKKVKGKNKTKQSMSSCQALEELTSDLWMSDNTLGVISPSFKMLLFHTKTNIYIDRENISTNTATTNVTLGAETASVLNVDKPLVNKAF